MKYFVTGVAGFIGFHLSQLLLRLNFNEFFVANSLSAGAERDVGEGVM